MGAPCFLSVLGANQNPEFAEVANFAPTFRRRRNEFLNFKLLIEPKLDMGGTHV